jgi:hypothetical protein
MKWIDDRLETTACSLRGAPARFISHAQNPPKRVFGKKRAHFRESVETPAPRYRCRGGPMAPHEVQLLPQGIPFRPALFHSTEDGHGCQSGTDELKAHGRAISGILAERNGDLHSQGRHPLAKKIPR